MDLKKYFSKRFFWIGLGISAFILNALFDAFPNVYEVVYFRGAFQLLRVVYDYLLGWFPIPMVYVVFVGVVILIGRLLKWPKIDSQPKLAKKILMALSTIFAFLGGFLFFFYVLWGFNYKQQSLASRLDFQEIKPDTSTLILEAKNLNILLSETRKLISKDTFPLTEELLPKDMESKIRNSLEEVLMSWEIPTYGNVRVRKLHPKGLLLRISTAGVYIPFAFEGHIDAGLHPIQYPFVMAHEMSHGYGIADEGTCNFTGFVACVNTDEPFIKYAGYIGLWRYATNTLRKFSPTAYKGIVKNLDPLVKRDLNDIIFEMQKYPDLMPAIRDAFYDTYLKTHGIKGGLSNYNTIIDLVLRWKESGYNQKIKERIW